MLGHRGLVGHVVQFFHVIITNQLCHKQLCGRSVLCRSLHACMGGAVAEEVVVAETSVLLVPGLGCGTPSQCKEAHSRLLTCAPYPPPCADLPAAHRLHLNAVGGPGMP